ncbi:MAG: carbohydrate ABC transporter permease [Clostridia bacterium]|nr:carbohydrate ABC transporter permease [Clostridia bacterium]MBR2286823.1 carbohydrate ABC transporter permease [Clostridia bacterium]
MQTSARKKIKGTTASLNRFGPGAQALFHVLLGLFALLCIIPFVFVIIISFTSEESIRQIGYSFHPLSWSTQAYTYTFQLGDQLWRSYANSFLITIIGTVLSVLMCFLYAYPLFRKDYGYRNFFNFLSFFTMIFGGGLVPTFVICKSVLGLSDNYAALIVPMLFSPFNIIIMRTFFQTSVPTELIEAATIDGSGEYGTLFRIVFPIVTPGIATVALLVALGYWNEWFLSLLYINKNMNIIPLQYLLMRMQRNADFLAKNSGMIGADASRAATQLPSQTLKMALVVFIVVPIACAYPFFQRYVVSGLTIGSVKG